jgi:hypothetical protein
MIYKAIASAIMASIFASAKKDIIETAKSRLLEQSMEDARKAMLSHVAQKYTEEVEYNVSQYIRALAESNVEIEFKGKPGEALISKAESAVKELEIYIEKQNPDGPIIQYLQQRYKEEGVRIITERLYGGHYINRKSDGIYEVANKMGYAANVDKRKPWLTGDKTIQGLENRVIEAALEIFELTFDNVDLSDEMATIKFVGAAQPKTPSGAGFIPTKSSAPKKKKRR